MNLETILNDGAPPIIAILRGVTPQEIAAVATSLVEAGVRLIEVPLNSPDPIESIRRLVDAVGSDALCGAGTVLDEGHIELIAAAGGKLIVTPNVNTAVIARAVNLGLDPIPGFVSPSEAFKAIAAGARQLKLFPATSLGPAYLKAVREIVPPATGLWAVGGTSARNLNEWLSAGAAGIGVGGALFKPGDASDAVGDRAKALVDAWLRATCHMQCRS